MFISTMVKDNDVKCFKRIIYPRKAKEQSAINLENVALMMEIIEASMSVEDISVSEEKKSQQKTKSKLKETKKDCNISNQRNGKGRKSPLCILPCSEEIKEHDNHSTNGGHMRTKGMVLISNAPGLSHFMELEERTDLLSNTTVDPLGPDSFDNFQWVEVKQELPDDIEVCNVTFKELPLKVDNVYNNTEDSVCSLDKKTTLETNTSSEGTSPIEVDNPPEECEIQESENKKIKHSNKKRKTRPQECDVCGKKLSSKGILRLHKLKKHKQKVLFPCDLCGLEFEFQREVVQHRNTSHRQKDGRFFCKVCSKRFTEYHNFFLHLKYHLNNFEENENSEISCQICSKPFEDNESLKTHQKLVHHINEKELKEKLKPQEKNFICHTCGKRFAFECILRDHVNLHTGSKPYLCQMCGKSFAQKATLKQHTKTHNEIRPFQCPECALGFYGKGDLKKHVRKHTGERPYICEVCGEGFSRSTHLGVHRRSHTGERPYTCDVCGRGFTKRGDVVRHRRIHTGELPYLCQVCGKAFRQSTQCANHIKSQHPDMPVVVTRNPNPLYQRVQSQLFF